MPDAIRTIQNDTVDALCWRFYGRTAGVTEAVLEANPGLATTAQFCRKALSSACPKSKPARHSGRWCSYGTDPAAPSP